MKQETYLINIIIGPCTRPEAEECGEIVQEFFDMEMKHMGAAIAVEFLDKQKEI